MPPDRHFERSEKSLFLSWSGDLPAAGRLYVAIFFVGARYIVPVL